jgi:hypothetical protein
MKQKPTIEKGVPMPQSRYFKYDLEPMEPTDSFFVPCRASEVRRKTSSILATAKKRFPDRKYSVYVEGQGLRCWRVK